MSEGPILHLYKYGRKTELHTDACKQGYGAILLQEAEDGKLHPVYYMSKKTNTAEENISEDYAKKELITRIARWALQLEEFDYEIEHRAGSRMKHVDALSRYPVMMYLNGRELIVTPKAMQAEIIKLIHENGHFSVRKTEEIVKQEFFIPNLSNVVKKVIVNCVPCILANKKTGKKEGFLNPISKESIPLSTYHVDFIGPLPSTNKSYQHIFTVVDAFTKFTWLNPVKGVPRGNGQVERIHRALIPVLTKLSLDDSTKWYKYVDRLQRILNSTINRSTKWTPFELLVGIKMRNKEDILIKNLLLEEMAKELLEQREFLRNDAKKNIETLQS
ncbi:hypothetical protein TNCV_1445781 [Trichonephila clavipes]|nr:hypothetical protein TNCV_1445781 [Trichonephila clavipes]